MIMFRGFAEAHGFGAGTAPLTRDASGQLIFDATGAKTQGTNLMASAPRVKLKFLVKASGLTSETLVQSVIAATKVVLPPGISARASNVVESWSAVSASQPGWFVVTKMVAVGRQAPAEATGTTVDAANIGSKIQTIPGVEAVELDRVATATATGTVANPATGTTPNPPTGTLPEEGARTPKPEEKASGGAVLFLAIGVGIAAWALTR